jgi:hypothetical protein
MTDKDVATLTEEEEEQEICDRVQEENRGLCRPRPSHVEDNAGRRTMSKLRVNASMCRVIPVATACTLTLSKSTYRPSSRLASSAIV